MVGVNSGARHISRSNGLWDCLMFLLLTQIWRIGVAIIAITNQFGIWGGRVLDLIKAKFCDSQFKWVYTI